jgi:hypothetical protein
MSTELTNATPAREARIPINLRMVKVSTRYRTPKTRVKMLLVLVRIVEEATVVWRRERAMR